MHSSKSLCHRPFRISAVKEWIHDWSTWQPGWKRKVWLPGGAGPPQQRALPQAISVFSSSQSHTLGGFCNYRIKKKNQPIQSTISVGKQIMTLSVNAI